MAQKPRTAPLQQQQQPAPAPIAPPADWGPPTTVLLLRNVVSPGQIDESLDEEIGIECSKYGQVTR